jgi:hypothetical protein
MPQGPEHVQEALKWMQNASTTISTLDGLEEDWATGAVARLAAASELLQGTMDRFFLKTKVCTPFAQKCEAAAKALDALLAELRAEPAADAQSRLDAALVALEKAARTLDERSLMQGMAIT